MNNSKLWLVVHPTVGIPVFLGAVAVGSFAVHVAVLSNTGWVSDFLSGNELGSTQAALNEAAPSADGDRSLARVYSSSSVEGTSGKEEFVVVLPDGRIARAVLDGPTVTAQATTGNLLD